MKNILGILLLPVLLGACTHASISSIPMEIEGVGSVYRYQGRANFSHQMEKADKMIIAKCQEVNGGKPTIVNLQKVDLGVVSLNSGQANTRFNANAFGSPYNSNISGSANTSYSGSSTGMRNYNQEILFKCAAD